jgi:hypothetical protein
MAAAPATTAPAVAEGMPVPREGLALSDADIRRAEREAFLHELHFFCDAVFDLASETLAFAGILAFASTAAASSLAVFSVISKQFDGVAVHACAAIHPGVTAAQIPSLWLCIVTGSSQMRSYYRVDGVNARMLRASLFMYEFFFLFALVTPHSLLEQQPVLSSAHCAVDHVLRSDQSLPLQSLAVGVFALARCTILGLLWLISLAETFAHSLQWPARLPGLLCLHGSIAVYVLMHMVSFAGYMGDALLFLIASADEVVTRCALALVNYRRPPEWQKPYRGSTLGANVLFTKHPSTLQLALHDPATPVILAIFAGMLGFTMAACSAQAQKLRRDRAHGQAAVVGERAN